jgi:hypothetical protein
MTRASFPRGRAALTVTAALVLATSASAQVFLDMTVVPTAQSGVPGSVQSWDVSLTNSADEAATFRLTAFTPGLLASGVDIGTDLLPESAFALAPGETVTLTAFYVTSILTGAEPGDYDGLAAFTYDSVDSGGQEDFDLGASAAWQLTVMAPVSAPEPSSLPVLALFAAPLVWRRGRA